MLKPTKETYTDFQKYYDLLNEKLFGGKLPNCLITYQRGKSFMAYYCPRRFAKGEIKTDEIAMNPTAFLSHDKTQILQTLLHEMCHLEQEHFGTPSRGGYHNKEWGMMMKRVGLQPFGVGKSNYGKETGQQMNDRIIEGGVFEKFINEDKYNFCMWVDAITPAQKITTDDLRSEVRDSIINVITNNDTVIDDDDTNLINDFLDNKRECLENAYIEVAEDSKRLSQEQGSKIKYTCDCGHNIWGKEKLKLLCLDCKAYFIYAE